MDSPLERLMKRMPPPNEVRDCDVDWKLLEFRLGLTYPTSFKEFIGIYGASIWFDHACPYYSTGKTDADVMKFRSRVTERLKPLRTNVRDERYKRVNVPLYPDEGGLFPFLVDYSGSLYCWKTDRKDPAEWPVVCWVMGPLIVLENLTIAQMMLEWLERSPRMVDLWGDPNDLPSERIQLS